MRRGVCKNILYPNALELVRKENAVVIDVREADEVSGKSFPGSINIPINELTNKIKEIVSDRNQPILVYCSTGSRSIFACQILADYGYNRVYNLYGGFQ